MSYSNLSIKRKLSNEISMANIAFERNRSYSSYSTQSTLCYGVVQEREYDTVYVEPCKQLVYTCQDVPCVD